jgi:hypothetical protein
VGGLTVLKLRIGEEDRPNLKSHNSRFIDGETVVEVRVNDLNRSVAHPEDLDRRRMLDGLEHHFVHLNLRSISNHDQNCTPLLSNTSIEGRCPQ